MNTTPRPLEERREWIVAIVLIGPLNLPPSNSNIASIENGKAHGIIQ